MKELREKANSYAEEKFVDVMKEAFAKVYADGYRDGYKDREEEMPIDLRDNKTEFVDLGLPSGTLWSADYEKENDETIYLPYQEAKVFQIPTENLWKELIENCQWQGKYFNSGQSFYGITCIGPNGNSVIFKSKGYVEDNKQVGLGENVYFWFIDDVEGNFKRALRILPGRYQWPEKEIVPMFSGFKLPIRLVKNK